MYTGDMDKDKITKHESYSAINVNRVSGQTHLKETVASAMSKLNGLTKQLDEALLPGNKPLGKKELAQAVRDIRHAAMEIEQNIPFLEDQFDEMMEKKVSGAVVEIESIVAHGLREAGMEHLRQQMPEYKLVEKQKGTALPQANPTFTLDCGCVVDENQLLSSCDDPNHQR